MTIIQAERTQSLTIELLMPVYQQLASIAASTKQSMEAIVLQSISGNLPPSVENMPVSIQPELLAMQTQDNEKLLITAHSRIPTKQQERHQDLLDKHSSDSINPEEKLELSQLRQNADSLMVRKAYAWSILRWRGHRVPSLQDLPVS